MDRFQGRGLAVLMLLALGAGDWCCAASVQLTLHDGRVVTGRLGKLKSMAEMGKGVLVDNAVTPIVFLNDELRRTFFAQRQIIRPPEPEILEAQEKITVRQITLKGGRIVHSLGPIIEVTPFDQYGRRTFSMNSPQGRIDIVQGITLITPTYTKVEGIKYVWDMRLATSSIPPDVLGKIFAQQAKIKAKEAHSRENEIEDRKTLARFFLQCGWYEKAVAELDALLAEYPEVKPDLESARQQIRKMSAERLLKELELRGEAGQHASVRKLLDAFPSQDVPAETLQKVRDMLQKYKSQSDAREDVLKQFDVFTEEIADADVRKRIAPIRKELGEELSINTLGRMTAFRQFAGAADIPPADKVAIAISGWLLGAKGSDRSLSGAISLFRTRAIVRKYLAATSRAERVKILAPLDSEEAAKPEQVAMLIARMKPPVPTDPPEDESSLYKLDIPGSEKMPPVSYYVALPPEYDPYRLYPAIVTLRGARTTCQQQLDFWSGEVGRSGSRMGQGSRRGYIVIAPDWAGEGQSRYGFTLREHAAVLGSLRDACKRFSIDTDRVFLTGHAMGGDAAWDIGLAHPDFWAGVIPFDARRDRYIEHYTENAALVPFYFVNGELDGDKMSYNPLVWDRYLGSSKINRFNVTVVEFLGRGNEPFADEILRIYDWMGRLRRNFFPKEFKAVTMRPGDNYFWWVELRQLPAKAMVDPSYWPPVRGTHPAEMTGKIGAQNAISVSTGAGQVTVWLSPEMIDIDRKLTITVNGHRLTGKAPVPEVSTILEDVRTRGDRQHPFWAKVDSATGRLSVAE